MRVTSQVSLTCDGRVAAGTLFSVQAAETLDAVRTLPLRGEGLTGQQRSAARAEEALFVPHLVLVGDASFSQSLQNTHILDQHVESHRDELFLI